jgi:hypothetical protein
MGAPIRPSPINPIVAMAFFSLIALFRFVPSVVIEKSPSLSQLAQQGDFSI